MEWLDALTTLAGGAFAVRLLLSRIASMDAMLVDVRDRVARLEGAFGASNPLK